MSTDLSFNKDKMRVECGKLLRISNLGEKTLLGYIQNLKHSNDFSDLEWRFLKETTNLLIPSSVYVCAEYEDREAIVEWNKALIKATLGGTALPYVMTHTEEIHCLTKEDILTLYRKRYFFQNLFLFLTKDFAELKNQYGTLTFNMFCNVTIDGKYFESFYEYFSFLAPFDGAPNRSADDCIVSWLAATISIPDYIYEPYHDFRIEKYNHYWWYLVDDDGFIYYKELLDWCLKGTSAINDLKEIICDYTQALLNDEY